MAVNIGPRIGIEGESQYRKELNNIITQTKTLHAEMRTLESSFDKSTSAQKRSAAEGKLLRQQISVQEAEVEKLNRAVEESTRKYGENDARTLKWRQALANAQTELNGLNKQLQALPNRVQALGEDMERAGQKMQEAGGKITSVGSTLTKSVTAPIVALGTAAVKVTADFDASMSKVAAVSGATGQDLAALEEKAREMGATTKFSASEAAEALNYMAMAGWKTEEMLNGIDGVMSLAAASGADLATTSDIVTDALTAFGEGADQAGRLADIMAAASSNANTNVEMMGETFKKVAPVAGSLGFSMEDTALVTGLMANAGIKASDAGTAMRRGFTNLVKPTKQMQTAMEKYGIAITNSDGTMKDMRTVVTELRSRLGGLSKAEQTSAAASIFGANAYAAWLAVINGSEKDFDKLADAIDNSAGTAKDMADTMQDNLSGQLTILKSQAQELAISFGKTLMPSVRDLVTSAQGFVDKLNSMDEGQRKAIIKIAAFAAAVGPAVVALGTLETAGGKVVATVGKLVKFLGGAPALMSALPFAAVAAGAVALTVGLNKIAKANKGTVDSVETLGSAMRNSIADTERSTTALTNASKSITDSTSGAVNSVKDIETTAALARQYGDELIALSSKTSRTTVEQAKMETTLAKLKEIYPGFTGEIDKATGALNLNTQEINNQITALEKQAKAQAYQEIYEEITKGIVEAEKKRVQAEMELDKLGVQSAETQDALNKVVEAQAKAQKNATTEAGNAYDQYVEIDGELVDVNQAYETYSLALSDSEEAQKKSNAAIEEAKTVSAEATAEAEKYRQMASDLGINLDGLGTSAEGAATDLGTVEEATTDLAATTTTAAEEIDEASQAIIDAYGKTYESAYESITGQSGLYSELEEAEATSVEAMLKNLEAHANALASWNKNTDTVLSSAQYQTDETFRAMVNSIILAGEDMAPELQAIVDAMESGDENLTKLSENYGNLQGLADDYATNMGTVEAVTKNGLETVKGLYDSGQIPASAALMAKTTTDNLTKNTSTARMQSELLAPIGLLNRAKGQATTTATQYADAYGTGVAAGDTQADSIPKEFTASRLDVAKQKSQAIVTGRDIAKGYASGVADGTKNVRASFDAIKLAGEAKLRANESNAVTWGQNLVNNFALGIDSARQNAVNAASRVAQAVGGVLSRPSTGLGTVNPDMISGRSAGLDPGAIYRAVKEGAAAAETSVVIGEREFMRILRNAGVVLT